MAGITLGVSSRLNASAAEELIYSVGVEDLADLRTVGGSPVDPKFPLGFTMSWPAQWLKVAHQIGTGVVPRTFPYDGDGNVDAYSATGGPGGSPILTLDAAGIPDNEDYAGMVVQMQGTARAFGEFRRIVAYTGSTSIAQLNRAFDTVPNAGDPYRVLVPGYFRRIALVKGENNNAAAGARFRVVWYDFPRTPSGAKRASIPSWSRKTDLDDTGDQLETVESSYYHQEGKATEVDGMVGFKVRLTDLTAGTQSLWACAG